MRQGGEREREQDEEIRPRLVSADIIPPAGSDPLH